MIIQIKRHIVNPEIQTTKPTAAGTMDEMATREIFNFIKVNHQISTGGMPTRTQIEDAALEGFKAVINLAPPEPGYFLEDEANLVQEYGMQYFSIPVLWDNPTEEDFRTFEKTLMALGKQKVLIHCIANFRATAFYSLYALKNLAWSREQACAFRQQVWQGETFPVWQRFIRRMEEKILQETSHE